MTEDDPTTRIPTYSYIFTKNSLAGEESEHFDKLSTLPVIPHSGKLEFPPIEEGAVWWVSLSNPNARKTPNTPCIEMNSDKPCLSFPRTQESPTQPDVTT